MRGMTEGEDAVCLEAHPVLPLLAHSRFLPWWGRIDPFRSTYEASHPPVKPARSSPRRITGLPRITFQIISSR